MSEPVAYDVKMTEIAAHCLEVVAKHVGVAAGDLRPIDFDIVRVGEPDRWVGRVRLAAAPAAPETFEPGASR